jgi:hypothetical protein
MAKFQYASTNINREMKFKSSSIKSVLKSVGKKFT